MIQSVIEWWVDLVRRGKYVFCFSVLAFGLALLLAGRIWFAGWAIGGVLLLCTLLKVGED